MHLERHEMRGWVIDLVAKCPRCDPLPDCPVLAIRRSPLRERLCAVGKMPDLELDTILDHHRKCIAERSKTS